MIATGITSGHQLLSDWLFLIAGVLFLLAGLIAALQRPDPSHASLVPLGLAVTVVAFLVL